MTAAISTLNLRKFYRYGIRGIAVAALDGISFDVQDGEVFGLIGPNGAGKSTTIKILLGLVRKSAGECSIFGNPVSINTKRQIGYLPESPYFYKFLSGFELVRFYARLSGMSSKESKTAAMKALNMAGLDDAADRPLSVYSKGMVQRAGLAQAIVHNPKLVILDEPASGLDPVGTSDMAEMIRRLRDGGKTVLLCSHQMNEVEKLCSRVAILLRGRVAAEGSLGELLNESGKVRLDLNTSDPEKIRNISEFAKGLGVKAEAAHMRLSLEDYFKKIVGGKK